MRPTAMPTLVTLADTIVPVPASCTGMTATLLAGVDVGSASTVPSQAGDVCTTLKLLESCREMGHDSGSVPKSMVVLLVVPRSAQILLKYSDTQAVFCYC